MASSMDLRSRMNTTPVTGMAIISSVKNLHTQDASGVQDRQLGMVLTARFRGGSCQLKSNFLRSLHKKTLASLTNSSTTCQSTTWMSGDMLRYHVVLMDSKLMCRRSTTQSAVFTIAAWRGLTMPYERLSGKSPMKERRCVKM